MKLLSILKKYRRRLALSLVLTAVAAIGLLIGADHLCQRAAAGRMFSSVETMPAGEVGLVLGTSKTTPSGNPNLHFKQRIRAAAALYHAGKVQHLLVSGDNHVAGYDEPTDMQEALVAAGVPLTAITRDYAGFRTLDSVVRAKEVFGLKRCTIITEEFHCSRALWIAQAHGLDAVAFAAPDVDSLRWSARVKMRECLARAWCGLDLYVLHREPKFSGPPEPIQISSAK